MPQVKTPQDAGQVLYSPEELRQRGIDPASTPCCAVPDKDGNFRGCSQAGRCIFRNPENGGYGPKQNVPKSEGQGPDYVAIYHENSASGTAIEKYMKCDAFMAGLYDDYRQQEETGDKIVILGGPGTVIVQEYLLPEDPNSNKTGNSKMKLVEKELAVPTFRSWRDGSTDQSRRDQILRMQDKRRRLNNVRRMEAAGLTDAQEPAEVESEPVAGVVSEPVAADRKRGGKG